MPKGVINLIFHMNEGMAIPTIATLQDTVHCLNHTAMRLKGVTTMNAALDNALKRESQFKWKNSTIVRAQEVYNFAMHIE